LSNEDTVLKEAYSSFNQKLSFVDFQSKLNSLAIDKWNFVRATLLYQQAVKCGDCNPNVGMVLLCSCANALQLVGEGKPWENFKEFYLTYCPAHFRTPPIEYYPNGKIPRTTAPFEKALRYIYKQFRNLFVHEGIGYLITAPDGIDWHTLYDKIKNENDVYSVDMMKIAEWFRQITFESLFAIL
jgi:hypothetical protein